MEILEEAMENRHTTLVTKDIHNSRTSESCEFLKRIQKFNTCNEHNEGKQNIGFGAPLPTTMHPTKTEIKIAPTETCAAVVEVEIPLDVPELRIATDEGDANPESTTDGCKVVKNLNKDKLMDEDDNDVRHDHQANDEPSQESSPLAAEDENDDDLDNSDDESTTDSDFSDMSDGSSESGREWKPIKPINWVQKQIHSGADPRELLSQMLPNSGPLAPGLNDMTLWRILASMLAEPPRRQKLRNVNTFADVIQLVRESKNVIVLTGAGVSVSCGIPDFRSSDGIYSRLAKDFPDLPDPQAMFDINYFSRDPRPFYKFAREIYPGQFKPSPCHSFIKLLETKQKLLRNYTQNIDTLEQVAGIQNVIECHGSFSTASCTKCKFKTTADVIRADIFAQRIPVCPHCQPNIKQSACASEPVSEVQLREIVENGIMKPDIVFFGEGLPEKFHNVMAEDKDKCDLLIVIGSSLKVRPVALIPSSIPAHVPQILINREQLHHLEFDVELLGDSDVIINQLCHHLGGEWKQICFDDKVLYESTELLPREEVSSCNEEDDVQHQYRLDNDTQSVKSNASTDIAIRSSGGYSDSGFESSTSSVVVGGKPALVSVASDADAEATNSSKNIQSNSLSLSETKTISNIKCNKDLLSPVLLDDNMDASASFEHTTFQTFHPATTGNCRHLSIDSSKDSGIQCNDSPNSAAPLGPLLPSLSYFSDTGGKVMPPDLRESVSATVAPAKDLPAITQQDNCVSTAHSVNGCKIKHERKRVTAADRLIEGTYYCHETSSSYAFPGAQVFWFTASEDEEDIDEEIDFDEEEEEDDEEEEDEDFDIEEEDTLQAISPILPPAIEAEVVAEITTHRGGMNAPKKRNSNEHSNEDNSMRKNKRNDSLLHGASTTTSIALSSSPPTKRRCDDNDTEQTLVTTTISSTTPTNGNLQVALLETKTTPSAPEALLQQL